MIHNNGTLVISGTLHKDAGMYVCQAKNVLGITKSTILLIVHGMSNTLALVKPYSKTSQFSILQKYLTQTAPQEGSA